MVHPLPVPATNQSSMREILIEQKNHFQKLAETYRQKFIALENEMIHLKQKSKSQLKASVEEVEQKY